MVSIIIPVYNGKQYINNVLQSVLKQSYKNIETIVINDGSTDGLDEEDIKKIHPSVKYYTKKNEGLGFTRNFGMRAAKGDYIFFLDVDDTLPMDAIKVLRESIEKNDFIIGQCQRVYLDKKNHIYKKKLWKKKLYKSPHDKYHLIMDTLSTNKLYKRKFLVEYNIEFSTGLYEDKFFVLKLFENSNRFKYINKIIYYWHVYEGSTSITNSLGIQNLDERMEANQQCLTYTKDNKMKHILVRNIIKHDFKLYVNQVKIYSDVELEKLYEYYKKFVQEYYKYILIHEYFVDRIIIENIDNKKLLMNEFRCISKENSTKNILVKLKKYIRYSRYFMNKRVLCKN